MVCAYGKRGLTLAISTSSSFQKAFGRIEPLRLSDPADWTLVHTEGSCILPVRHSPRAPEAMAEVGRAAWMVKFL